MTINVFKPPFQNPLSSSTLNLFTSSTVGRLDEEITGPPMEELAATLDDMVFAIKKVHERVAQIGNSFCRVV